MNMKEIVVEYSQQDHYGSWDMQSIVSNADELFQFMRECHLRDARNRSEYPLASYWIPESIQFYRSEFEVCNLGHKHYSEESPIIPPDFYEDGLNLYLEWKDRIERTIPHLRKVYKQRKIEEKEKQEYERLKEKYETN